MIVNKTVRCKRCYGTLATLSLVPASLHFRLPCLSPALLSPDGGILACEQALPLKMARGRHIRAW